MFKGTGFIGDMTVDFSSEDGYCRLDGYKVDMAVFTHVQIRNHEDLQSLIDYLEILKLNLTE